MGDLFVHLEIPISTTPLVGAEAIAFARWLPIGDGQAINVERDNIALKLWFDITSTWWASQDKEEDLTKRINVLAHRVFADTVVHDVPDDLLHYMAERDFARPPTQDEESLQQRYDEVAERCLSWCLIRSTGCYRMSAVRRASIGLVSTRSIQERCAPTIWNSRQRRGSAEVAAFASDRAALSRWTSSFRERSDS